MQTKTWLKTLVITITLVIVIMITAQTDTYLESPNMIPQTLVKHNDMLAHQERKIQDLMRIHDLNIKNAEKRLEFLETEDELTVEYFQAYQISL